MSDYIKVEESYVDALIQNAAWGAAKVKLDEALSAGQKKLDTDKDGKIEGEDLAKLRKGKAKKEAMDPKEKVKEASKAKMKKEPLHPGWVMDFVYDHNQGLGPFEPV